jgi:hypothetical protein
MAHFGNYIASIIKAERNAGKDTTATSMAARMGIRGSMMSRFLNDPQARGVNPKTLEKMCRGISDDPAIRAGLRIAYLKDQIGTGRDVDLIRIDLARAARTTEIDEPPAGEVDYDSLRRASVGVRLDVRSLGAIEKIIRATARSHRFRRCVRDLGDIAEQDILGD